MAYSLSLFCFLLLLLFFKLLSLDYITVVVLVFVVIFVVVSVIVDVAGLGFVAFVSHDSITSKVMDLVLVFTSSQEALLKMFLLPKYWRR